MGTKQLCFRRYVFECFIFGNGYIVINEGPTVLFGVDCKIAMPLPVWVRFCPPDAILCVVQPATHTKKKQWSHFGGLFYTSM